jgi:hypothetical protein
MRKQPKSPKVRPQKTTEHDETIHQTRYRDDVELDEYDEHKLQKMADDPTGSPAGGDGPDA